MKRIIRYTIGLLTGINIEYLIQHPTNHIWPYFTGFVFVIVIILDIIIDWDWVEDMTNEMVG